MKELLFGAGVIMIGYWVYLKCQDKKELKPIVGNNSNEINYTTPPQSLPLNSDDNFPASTVQRFDASENSTVSRPITTIKVGINEPTDIQQIV